MMVRSKSIRHVKKFGLFDKIPFCDRIMAGLLRTEVVL